MKNKTFLGLLLAPIIGLHAADQSRYSSFNATGTTAASVTLLSRSPSNRGVTVVSLDCTSDAAAARITFLSSTNSFKVLTAPTNLPLSFTTVTTNGLDGDVLVLRQDNYTTLIATVTNITGANVVQLNTSNVVLTAGDMVFKLLTNSTPLGVATLRQFGECIISSSDPAVGLQIASPLVIQVTGTLACAVNNVTVRH